MSKNQINAVSPEAILADEMNYKKFGHQFVRKGTVRATIENIMILESHKTNLKEKEAAINMIKKLSPDLIALQLHDYFSCRNALVEEILLKEAVRKNFEN